MATNDEDSEPVFPNVLSLERLLEDNRQIFAFFFSLAIISIQLKDGDY